MVFEVLLSMFIAARYMFEKTQSFVVQAFVQRIDGKCVSPFSTGATKWKYDVTYWTAEPLDECVSPTCAC